MDFLEIALEISSTEGMPFCVRAGFPPPAQLCVPTPRKPHLLPEPKQAVCEESWLYWQAGSENSWLATNSESGVPGVSAGYLGPDQMVVLSSPLDPGPGPHGLAGCLSFLLGLQPCAESRRSGLRPYTMSAS